MLEGKPVHHKVFGAGTVVAETDDTVSIHFKGATGRGATRKFMKRVLLDDDVFPKEQNAALRHMRRPGR